MILQTELEKITLSDLKFTLKFLHSWGSVLILCQKEKNVDTERIKLKRK